MFTAIYLTTTNDVNGNPRRGWLVFDDGREIGFVDEGYGGRLALPHALGLDNFTQVNTLASFSVTPGEYRDRKHGPQVRTWNVPTKVRAAGESLTPEPDSSAGTWLDGARGWTISAEIVRIAWQYGMPHSDWDEAIVDAYSQNTERVTLGAYGSREEIDVSGAMIDQGGMVDTAESWLNDHVAAEGYWFGSASDGDGWGYWPAESEDDESWTDPTPGVPDEVAPNAGSAE